MELEQKSLAEWQCQRTVLGFFRCLDESNYPALLAKMHPDGSWLRLGQELKGEKQIMEVLGGRSKALRIHHMLNNILVDISADGRRADLFGYLVVYRHDDGARHEGGAPLKGVSSISICSAELRESDGEWKIHRMVNKRSFTGE